MKIAITGSEGFLGKHLISFLSGKKYTLSLLNRKVHDLFSPKTLESFLNEVDVVIHLAGANRANNVDFIKRNMIGTAGLLEGMQKFAPNAKLIFSSSSQVYNTQNAYSLSKKLAEEAIEYFSRKSNIKAIVFRIANIYGPGGKPFYNSVIATFVHLIKNKQPVVINGTGNQGRDYIFVEDVVSAIDKAIYYNPQKPYECYDICSGKLTSVNEIVDTIKKNIDYDIKINYNRNVRKEGSALLKTYTKAEEALGWHPEVDIEKGLILTLKK